MFELYEVFPPVFAALRPDRTGAPGESVEDWPTESSASITECHPRKFLFQTLTFCSVSRFGKSFHDGKETLLLGFSRLKAGLDQINKHTIAARLSSLPLRAYTLGD